MSRRPIVRLALALAVIGCSSERDLPQGEGSIHPSGWTDPDDAAFHAGFLRDNGFPLQDCQRCHGDDFAGGSVAVSCGSAGCHDGSEQGAGRLDQCGTCHGEGDDPRPMTGAHAPHEPFCSTCHPVPDQVVSPGHIDGTVDLVFSGLAVTGGLEPSWDGNSCSGTYCHQAGSPSWDDAGPLTCSDCHSAPPDSHARFARVANEQTCVNCHPDPSGATHVDGALELGDPACNACHGGATVAPPLGLDGETDPSAASVGAHTRHLKSNLPGRIGRIVPCSACHPVPAAVTDANHLDPASPADVVLPIGGVYDSAGQSCQVWCHFGRTPGPTWTDDSGAARACDACHGYPPVMTRIGTPHPPATPSQCTSCHVFAVETHVDGEVNFQ